MEKQQSLIKVRLNIIDKITIRLTIRNLERARLGQVYKIWSEIKNEKIKFMPEILELAWSKSRTEDYKKFPTYFQEEKSKEIATSAIIYLSEECQNNIIKKDETMLDYVKKEIRESFLKDNPSKCIKYYKTDYKKIEEVLNLHGNPEIIETLPNEIQSALIGKNPRYIYYCDKEVKKEILSKSKISDPIWKSVIKNDSNITLKKWIKYFIISSSSERYVNEGEGAKNRKIIKRRVVSRVYDAEMPKYLSEGIKELFDSCEIETQESIIKEIETLKEEENKKLIINALRKMFMAKSLSISQEKVLLPILFNNEESVGRECFAINLWELSAINDNFSERFGEEKFEEYKSIIEKMKQGNISKENSNRILRLFFKEETIIKNVEPKKIIEYIEMYDEYIQNKKQYGEMSQRPVSLIAQERNVKRYFKEIIKDAFGESSLEIIGRRPGLNLFNISNTEIFNENITNSFSSDFIDDCLSYNFKNYDNWLNLMKSEEDIEAFKFYFNITSEKLGANVMTMQRCMLRYNEFRSLLIDASTKEEITSQQKENIMKLCMWPLNICNVENVEDLKDIDKKLKIKLKELDEDEKIQFDQKIQYHLENISADVDKVIYNFDSREVMSKAGLTEEEIDLFEFLEKEDFCITTERIIESAEHSDTLGIFFNKYSGFKKIKENQMEELNGQFTNMEKIDEAIEHGKYGVKKIEIDGFTYVDFGEMPVSFAVHHIIGNDSKLMMGAQLSKELLEAFLDYEEEDGISTISARPYNNSDFYRIIGNQGGYIYWNLEENEVINITARDGSVSHKGKMVQVSSGCLNRDNISIKDYKSISQKDTNSGEIAFYRRKREHNKEKAQKHGRKIIPDAAIGVTEYDVLKRFGKPITIIVTRGCLAEDKIEKFQQEVKQRIKETRKMIERERMEKEKIEKEIYEDEGR